MSTTYKVQFTGPRLSGKRFNDALQLVKNAGATYEESTKTWTVVVPDPEIQWFGCHACGGTGRARIDSREYCTLTRTNGRPCTGTGTHAHSGEACAECHGEGRTSRKVAAPATYMLRTLEQSYDAAVTEVADADRAALEEERATLLARIAEIDKLLA